MRNHDVQEHHNIILSSSIVATSRGLHPTIHLVKVEQATDLKTNHTHMEVNH